MYDLLFFCIVGIRHKAYYVLVPHNLATPTALLAACKSSCVEIVFGITLVITADPGALSGKKKIFMGCHRFRPNGMPDWDVHPVTYRWTKTSSPRVSPYCYYDRTIRMKADDVSIY